MGSAGRAPGCGRAVPAAAEPGRRRGLDPGPAGHRGGGEFCRACHTATGGNPLFLRELLRALEAPASAPRRPRRPKCKRSGQPRSGVLYCTGWPGWGQKLACWPKPSRCSATRASSPRRPGRGPGAGRGPRAADELVRAGIFAPPNGWGSCTRSCGRRCTRTSRRASARRGTPRRPRCWRPRALAERVTAHLLRTGPTGDPGGSARSGRRRRAPPAGRTPGGGGAAAAGAGRIPGRAGARGDPDRAGPVRGGHDGLRGGRGPPVRGGDVGRRADHPGRGRVVTGAVRDRVRRRSAQAAADALASLGEQLRPADPDRSVELGSELLLVTTAVPELRGGLAAHLERFGELARGHRGYAALTRIVRAQERLFRGAPATAAVAEVQAALMNDLPPRARTDAVLLALMTLHYGEQYDLATRLLDIALDGARQEGHATRQGLIHGQRAVLALAQGALHDAQVEAETGLLLVAEPHFTVLQLLAVAITVHIERGELDAAADLASRVEPAAVAEDHTYVPGFLVARGRLRIAQGRGRGSGRPAVVRAAAGRVRAAVAERLAGRGRARAGRARPGQAGQQAGPGAGGDGPAGRRARGAGQVAARRRPGEWRRRRAGLAARSGRGAGTQRGPAGAGVRAGRPRPDAEPGRSGGRKAGTGCARRSSWPANAVRSRWPSGPRPSCTPGRGGAPGPS